MRRTIASVTVAATLCAAHAAAGPAQDRRAEQQASLTALLTTDTATTIANARSQCASGRQPGIIARGRAAGASTLPDAADFCITVLTRLGRDGTLTAVRDTSAAGVTPALAFDSGFVAAYRKREAVPAGLPSLAAIKPVVERCLAQVERDTDLCFSVGYAAGARAARGEVVTVR